MWGAFVYFINDRIVAVMSVDKYLLLWEMDESSKCHKHEHGTVYSVRNCMYSSVQSSNLEINTTVVKITL